MKYTLQPEHEAQFGAIVKQYTDNAFSTKPMDEHDRDACRRAVADMYRAAGLEAPLVVFVPSPFVLRFAAGFASAIWATRVATRVATDDATDAETDDATDAETYVATDAATRDATDEATYVATYVETDVATYEATYAETDVATYEATYAATDDATDDATRAATATATYVATRTATYDATYVATRTATYDATDDATYRCDITGAVATAKLLCRGFEEIAWRSAINAHVSMWQGGNQWSWALAFHGFFRDVVKLGIDYTNYNAWHDLGTHSGPRCVHKKFCMISDRPRVLLLDDQNRLHCTTGPACEWPDGSAIYSVEGIRVPRWIVEHPHEITEDKIFSEPNAEVRRIMMQLYGAEKLLESAAVVDTYFQRITQDQSVPCALYQMRDKSRWLYCTDGSTGRCYVLPCRGNTSKCRDALEQMHGIDDDLIELRS